MRWSSANKGFASAPKATCSPWSAATAACATQKELARHVRYLQAEHHMLRSCLPARISLTTKEKNRLVRLAAKLGSALNCLATIVHPAFG
jgi:hypothetical protein